MIKINKLLLIQSINKSTEFIQISSTLPLMPFFWIRIQSRILHDIYLSYLLCPFNLDQFLRIPSWPSPFFLIAGELFYNVGLISVTRQGGWISHQYTCVSSLLNLSPTSHSIPTQGCHRAPGWAPHVIQQLPTSCLTCGDVRVSMLLSQLIPPSPSPCVSTGPFSLSASLFSSAQFSSVAQSRPTLHVTSGIAAHQAFLSVTNSQSIPKLKAIESVMPSSHQKEKLNRFQRNEPRTINDSSYYADMLIQIYLFMEVDIQSGSRQKREFKRKEFEMCLIVQLPACCFSNWPTRLV